MLSGRENVSVAVRPGPIVVSDEVICAQIMHELYERKVTMQELHAAISSLPDKQAKRIYAHFILGMTKQDLSLIHI